MTNNKQTEIERALRPIWAATKLKQVSWVYSDEDDSISLFLSTSLECLHINAKGQIKITDEEGVVLFNAEDIESETAKKIYKLVRSVTDVSTLWDFVKTFADEICGKETNA